MSVVVSHANPAQSAAAADGERRVSSGENRWTEPSNTHLLLERQSLHALAH